MLEELAALIDHNRNLGAWRFEKNLAAFSQQHGWQALLPTDDKREFRSRADALRRWAGKSWYQALRLYQLKDGKFAYWVYLASDCDLHADFHQIALPPDHHFWATHFPANGWACSCDICGTNTRAGILRLGGLPDKSLPTGWDETDLTTGLPRGIEPLFAGQVFPDLSQQLQALEQGKHKFL